MHLGCSDQEKFHSQLVSFNIELEFTTPPKGTITDKLEDTICYLELVQSIKFLCQTKQFNLIEHLTIEVYHAIDKSLFRYRDIVQSVSVTTRKMSPPIQDVHGDIAFTYCSALCSKGGDNDLY
ncbi:dihydroneopterin aldolase [Candidatus Tisiphia endosymbiont of Mystacides longicornis]|uniref:dihydroneopterin aldolase n=1 Tax=Candidatus Tisiphia endosymbiont of Mystacides longicornis TaxID=3139330 RepID=UPI003CCAD41B